MREPLLTGRGAALSVLLLGACASPASAQQTLPWIVLPTENRAIWEGQPAKFYMYVDRVFEGQTTKPWEGGQYGFTRDPRRVGNELVFTRFHEGIDIRPVRRDGAGEPLDPVLAAATGKVVHVSEDARASNYGKYLILEHLQNGSPYYTLYAHLRSIGVQPGEVVRQGQPIGQLGYTGAGINRERAHLHFEFCLLLQRNFEAWFEQYLAGQPNRHGIFNGLNLVGLDPIGLLRAVRANPQTSAADYIRRQTPLFRIVVNDSPYFDLLQLYPWMVPRGEPATAPAWAVTFSEQIIPMRIEPRPARVAEPRVEWLGPSSPALSHQSRNLIRGTPQAPRLTDSGRRFAHLLTFPDQ